MENLKQTCAEIKLNLIKRILDIDDCDQLVRRNKAISMEWFTPPFDGEIEEIDYRNEVAYRNSSFGNFPVEFIIENIEAVFKANLFSSCFHIYFIKKDTNISLLIRFNNIETNDFPVNFKTGDILYELIGTQIRSLTDYRKATDYVNNFEAYYNSTETEGQAFTQYITFHARKIVENFYGFEKNTKLIVGAKADKGGNLRLNLILEIDKDLCKNSILATGDKAYYNIGNMQP